MLEGPDPKEGRGVLGRVRTGQSQRGGNWTSCSRQQGVPGGRWAEEEHTESGILERHIWLLQRLRGGGGGSKKRHLGGGSRWPEERCARPGYGWQHEHTRVKSAGSGLCAPSSSPGKLSPYPCPRPLLRFLNSPQSCQQFPLPHEPSRIFPTPAKRRKRGMRP